MKDAIEWLKNQWETNRTAVVIGAIALMVVFGYLNG